MSRGGSTLKRFGGGLAGRCMTGLSRTGVFDMAGQVIFLGDIRGFDAENDRGYNKKGFDPHVWFKNSRGRFPDTFLR